jgi:3D (Asp-Asp-Asp) domain-containing protein
MRRNAFSPTLSTTAVPAICALLALVLIGAVGKADEKAAPRPPQTIAEAMIESFPTVSESAELLHETVPLSTTPRPRTLVMEVTAYCPCKKCCGKNARGITASGLKISHNDGLFVAADAAVFPFHTKLLIPGYAGGKTVPVLDRGGAIKGNKLDVFFPTHEAALEWGRRNVVVTIVD